MAAAADAGYISGLFYAWVAMRDSNGYPMGTLATPDAPVAGTTYNAYKLPNPVEGTVPAPTREIATFRGGLSILGQRAMGVSDFGTFDLTLPAHDETLMALASAMTIDVSTHGNLAIYAPNTRLAALPQMILGLVAGMQTDDGTNQYLTIVFGNVQLGYPNISAGQDSGTNPRPVTITVTPSSSTRTGWGMLYSALGVGVQDNADIVSYVRYTKPMQLTTYIDNASGTTYVSTYKPTSTDATNATNIVLKNGAKTNPTSIVIATGTTTITAASSGDIWTQLIPTDFVAV